MSTSIWLFRIRHRQLNYHRQTCFHRIQINLCIHAQQPLLIPTFSLLIVLILTAWNIYRFTKPFAVAQLLESIISAIGLLMSGSMWYMNLFFSSYPQMPYSYVAYVFLLTYTLPRVWISELERSRITVEEVKPLLHDEVKFRNDNCVIQFNDDDEDDEISVDFTRHRREKSVIRTTDISPGEIFSSVLDKYDTKPSGCL
ncbi:unnamed protein product [Adineta ricciae]|uniref:Uncharacterized protein n=1 Tax=Adineta ricciae TaxID=249248 RepID=A0A814GGD7_ADIRI|nr:unnamed protein product [Adineta ricciae]